MSPKALSDMKLQIQNCTNEKLLKKQRKTLRLIEKVSTHISNVQEDKSREDTVKGQFLRFTKAEDKVVLVCIPHKKEIEAEKMNISQRRRVEREEREKVGEGKKEEEGGAEKELGVA